MHDTFKSVHKLLKNNNLIVAISSITLIFLILLAFDISPYLRGPDDQLLESRWPYYFINTFDKIWAPILCFLTIVLTYKFFYKNLNTVKKELLFLMLLVVITFLFQLSLVYFSRFGLTVLFRRMVDPGINGYFSSAVKIDSIPLFVSDYESTFSVLDNHGKGHPPGSVMILRGTIATFKSSPALTNATLSFFRSPKNSEAKELWNPLKPYERAAAISGAFLLHFLATLTLIPFYFLIKKLKDKNASQKAVLLLALSPSFSFFALFFDPFYASIPLVIGLLLSQYKRASYVLFVCASGLMTMLGLFFSYSILPALAVIICTALILAIRFRSDWIKLTSAFIWGIIGGLGIMLVTGYDFFKNSQIIIENQMPREYLDWVIYNPYDFFIFMGLPISLLFLYISIIFFRPPISLSWNKIQLLVFWGIFIALIISGASRGEVGRIWIPLMTIPVGIVALHFSSIIKSEKSFYVILLLLFLQVIAMETFWVPIW